MSIEQVFPSFPLSTILHHHVHLTYLSNVLPYMIFLGSSTDEFQKTTLLISVNLPLTLRLLGKAARLPPAGSSGLPSVKTDEKLINMFCIGELLLSLLNDLALLLWIFNLVLICQYSGKVRTFLQFLTTSLRCERRSQQPFFRVFCLFFSLQFFISQSSCSDFVWKCHRKCCLY